MAYTAYTWRDGAAGGTPIVASRLNALEGGLSSAASVADSAATAAANAANAASSAASSASTASSTANAALTSAANAGTIASNLAAITYTKTQVDSLLATKAPLGSTTSSSGTGGGGAGGLTVVDMGDGTYEAVGSGKLLAGAGIDLTGVTVSTAGVQTFLDACVDGDTVVVPSGAIINLAKPVYIRKRITLTGSGELRWTGWDNTDHAINVRADGVTVNGVYMTNPSFLGAQTGNGFFGINVQGNSFRCVNSRILDFQTGVSVEANGEWHDIIIADNFIRVIGGGSGPSSTDSLGEDRGDGIVCWGAAATITGNRIHCLEGRDARIGIHCEALQNYETVPYKHGESLVTISANVVTGQFRRGIATEGVSYVSITGNAVADSTWWGISIIGNANFCTIASNNIKWTRTASDNQGSAWSPVRSPIMLYNNGSATYGAVVVNNNIHGAAGSNLFAGITVYGDNAAGMVGAEINGNQITDETGTMGTGVYVGQHVTDTQINDNYVNHFTAQGIYVWGGSGLMANGNRLIGPTSPAAGVRGFFLDGVAAKQVSNNFIRSVNVGISGQNGSLYTLVSGNVIQTATSGVDLFGVTGSAAVTTNIFTGVTTPVINAPSGMVYIGNNI